jgi:transcriptional regulator with XRE-family HTH domain
MSHLAKNLLYLRTREGLKQADLQEKTGIKRNTWSNWENEVAEPSVDDILLIAQFFDIGVDLLLQSDLENVHLMGKGESGKKAGKSPSKSPSNSPPNRANEPNIASWGRVPKIVTVDSAGNDNVVLVPVRARAGYLAGYEDPEFIQTLPSYRLPGLSAGTFRMFEVFGHSMIPTFHESDIMITRYVDNLLEIRDDRIYVVVTKRDGVVVKRVVNRVQRDGVLILNSDNQRHAGEYPPIIVNPEEVLEVWYAYAYMSRQMRAPGEMYNRLIDVESRLTLIEAERKKALPK